MQKRVLLILLIFVSLIVIGCQSEDEPSLESSDQDQTDAQAQEPANESAQDDVEENTDASSGELSLPQDDDQSGSILFVYQDDLYQAQFDGEIATLLVEGVDAASVQPVPSRNLVLYQPIDGTDVMALNLTDLSSVSIGDGTEKPPELLNVSPNQEWVSMTRNEDGLLIANLDGTVSNVLEWPGEEHRVEFHSMWLEDNSLIVPRSIIPFDEENGDWSDQLLIVNPVLGEGEDIFEIVGGMGWLFTNDLNKSSQFGDLNNVLTSNNLPELYLSDFQDTYAYPEDLSHSIRINEPFPLPINDVDPDIDPFNPPNPVCMNWSVTKQGALRAALPARLYETNDAVLLSDIAYVSENEALILEWLPTDCFNIDDVLSIRLLKVADGEEPVVIADNIPPDAIDVGPRVFFMSPYADAEKFALSPDKDSVVWIAETESGFSLMLSDVDGGSSTTLFTTADDIIQTIFWIE